MLCCLCGKVPTEPVVSQKTGHLFEKRLIIKYLQANGACPITKGPLTPQDLLEVKSTFPTPPQQPPRDGATASIPRMLEMFQNEWDALVLSQFAMRKRLDTSRQELSHALYQHDAACRVVARLLKQGDQATVQQPGDGVASSQATFQSRVVENIENTAKTLSAARKRRQLPAGLLPPDAVSRFRDHAAVPSAVEGACPAAPVGCISLLGTSPEDQQCAVAGRADGRLMWMQWPSRRALGCSGSGAEVGHRGAVSRVLSVPSQKDPMVVSASLDGTVRLWRKNPPEGRAANALLVIAKPQPGPVTDIAVHPTSDYVAIAAPEDTLWAFYDLRTGYCLHIHNDIPQQTKYKAVSFHPDGLILATGSESGAVEIWESRTMAGVTRVGDVHTGAINRIAFSENGYLMATASADSTVRVWDLRKFAPIQEFRYPTPANSCAFDASGVYLANAAGNYVLVYQSKVWKELANLGAGIHAKTVTDVVWGVDAKVVLSSSLDGSIGIMGV